MTARAIEVPWACRRTGECCRRVERVVMTPAERDELVRRRPGIAWRFVADVPGFVALLARPCPLLATDQAGLAVCTVHDVRPYNCRRFACGRVDVKTEPFEATPDTWGCRNLADRIAQSRPFRRFYARLQRRAQRWAVAHGWRHDVSRDSG